MISMGNMARKALLGENDSECEHRIKKAQHMFQESGSEVYRDVVGKNVKRKAGARSLRLFNACLGLHVWA